MELIDAKNKGKPEKRGKNIWYFYADSQYYFLVENYFSFFCFFWIFDGEIGGFSSLFTLYGYYTIYNMDYSMNEKFMDFEWLMNL